MRKPPVLPALIQRSLLLVGVVVLSVLTTLTIERLVDPAPAAAQGGQRSVQRASAFELVADNGAVLARLAPGPAGNGNLTLFSTAGAQRTVVFGNGTFAAFDPDGETLRYFSGYAVNPGLIGTPAVNGVLLDGDGSVGVLSGCPGPVFC